MWSSRNACHTLLLSGLYLGTLSVQSAIAYTAQVVVPEAPYEVFPIEEPFAIEQWYLGTLEQVPVMYEFAVAEPMSVSLSLRIPDTVSVAVMRPALLVVRDIEPRGVEEVARLVFEEAAWSRQTDARSRLDYFTPDPLTVDLSPGTYRVEVSTPNNVGQYMLVLGSEADTSRWSTRLATVKTLYDFYGISSVWLVRSPVVYYPVSFLFLVILVGLVWRYRAKHTSLQSK